MTRGNQRDQDRIKNQKKAAKKVNDICYTELHPTTTDLHCRVFTNTMSRKQPTVCPGRSTSRKRSRMPRSCEGNKQMVSIFHSVYRWHTIRRQHHSVRLSFTNSWCLKLADAAKAGSDKKKWPVFAWIHRIYHPPSLQWTSSCDISLEQHPLFWIITIFAGAHVFGEMPYVGDGNDGSMRAISYNTLDTIQGSWGLLAHIIIALYLARRYSNAEEFPFFVPRATYYEGTRDYINHTCCLKH